MKFSYLLRESECHFIIVDINKKPSTVLEKLLCQDSLFTYFKWNCKIILIYLCMFFFSKG